jgi:hypothetical protein
MKQATGEFQNLYEWMLENVSTRNTVSSFVMYVHSAENMLVGLFVFLFEQEEWYRKNFKVDSLILIMYKCFVTI